jgi:hypothetical protein
MRLIWHAHEDESMAHNQRFHASLTKRSGPNQSVRAASRWPKRFDGIRIQPKLDRSLSTCRSRPAYR